MAYKQLTEEEKKVMMDKMDAAGKVAMEEFHRSFSEAEQISFSCWFAAHYLEAGHKRLGRGLVEVANKVMEKVQKAAGEKDLTKGKKGKK